MRSLLALPLLAGAACTDTELGSLSQSQAATVYTLVTAELRNLHSILLATRPLPATYTYSCASGSIDLRISQDAMMEPVRLRHEIEACAMQDLMINGEIEYGSLSPCDDGETGTFAFTFGGLVDVGGSMTGFCYVEAHDTCGKVTGHICGFPARELTASP